jgi:hypothetical protein
MKKKKARNWQPCRVCRHEHQNPASSTLCSLACHKQEVGITMRKPLEIEIGDTVKIVETSQYYNNGATNPRCEGVTIKPRVPRFDYRVQWNNGATNSYNLHDLTLIKKGKTMQFTKSDLKTGVHFIRNRSDEYKIVLDTMLCGNSYTPLKQITETLRHNCYRELDIMSVYVITEKRSIDSYLKGESLSPIWERTEQTEAQKEMEVLQAQAKALQEDTQAIQEQITKLQGTL